MRQGRVDLRGHEVRHEADIATLGQVYRDPRFETFRIVYVKGDQVVATEGISSRLPDSTAAFVTNRFALGYYNQASKKYGPNRMDWPSAARDRYLQLIREGEGRALNDMRLRMHRLGADGYYLLHNHPSGDPLPSEGDRSVTALYESNVPGFRGHVIIDSKSYGFIRPFSKAEIQSARGLVPKNLNPGNVRRLTAELLGAWRKPEVRPIETDDRLLEPSIQHELLGRTAKTSSDIAALGQAMKDRKGVTLFYLSQRKIRAIETVPEKLYVNSTEMANHVRGRARAYGGMKVAAYSELSRPLVEAGRKLIARGVLHNAVTRDVGLRDIYGDPAEFEGPAAGQRVEEETREREPSNAQSTTDVSAFEGPQGSLELSLSGMRRRIVPEHRMADEGHGATDTAQSMLDRAYDVAVSGGKYSGVDLFVGGTGSGKSVTSEATPISAERRAGRIILESHAENADTLGAKIARARQHDLPVDVHVVIRDPVESFKSVVGRYNRAEAKRPGSGKVVPVNYGAATHEAVIENIPKLIDRYGNDPLVQWHFIDNRGMPVEAEEVGPEDGLKLLAGIDAANLRAKFNDVLDNARLTRRDRERFGDESLPSEFGSELDEASGASNAERQAAGYGERNVVFTKNRLARSQEAVRRKLNPNTLNAGIDPTVLPHLLFIAGYHLEAGSVKFADWSARMVNDLGDWIIPHLPELYDRALENIYWRSKRPTLSSDQTESLRNINRASGGPLKATREASGDVKFRRWQPGDAIDKPLPSGEEPTWATVRSRYWKNRHSDVHGTNEFSQVNLARMKIGRAPHDFNSRTGQWEPRELHHVIPRRAGGKSTPHNLRELRQDWHSEVDAFRIRPGIRTSRGIR